MVLFIAINFALGCGALLTFGIQHYRERRARLAQWVLASGSVTDRIE